MSLDAVRGDFPVLSRTVNGRPLVYLDSAASSQQPHQVIERVDRYITQQHSNVHRSAHTLSGEATEAYEGARAEVAAHIGAPSPGEIVFTRGATEAVNLVASSWGSAFLEPGDRVLLTILEHHSNIVPWQLLAARIGIELDFADITGDGRLDLDHYEALLRREPRLVGFTHVSNGLGTINPVAQLTRMAREAGALVLIDGAQAAPHLQVDVGAIGCDFYVFSGHKMCGPTGVGALWARSGLLDAMPPYQGGGEMISEVTTQGSSWAAVPYKFEAGTPNIAGAVGLGEAVRFLRSVGHVAIAAHEADIIEHALARLREVEGLRLYGPNEASDRTAVFSFTYGDIHPHDLATILDQQGIAIRAGHHCNQPLMDRLGVSATARASFYLYSTRADADALCEGLGTAAQLFGGIAAPPAS